MIDCKVEWTIDPIKQADKLSKGLRNKAIRIAINKSASPVKSAVVSNATKRFGYLSKSIRIKINNYKDSNVWVAVIGAKSDFVKTKGKYKKGKKKGEARVIKPSKYAKLVEKGTKRSKAKPYLRPALDSHGQQYLDSLAQNIKQQVDQILSQQA